MSNRRSFFAELKRRNVLRAAVLYVGAAWALSQGISQLSPALGLPGYVTRWFLVACVIGLPFWIVFAWFYEFTPRGFKRESDVTADAPLHHSNARRLDFGIIAVLAVAVVLLGSGYFVHRNAPARAIAAIPAKSIAVLPFENLNVDKQDAYFVAGMQDLILTKLADIGDLKVIARTSTAMYASHPENLTRIGQQLGVATILEGSVQQAGNEVLVNLQLIDTKTDSHIWAKAYTRTLTNVFGVEGDVAEQVAAALKTKLSPTETARLVSDMSSNPAANNVFLRAEYEVHQGNTNYAAANWKAAIPLYREAIAKAPNFALAYARLSFDESQLAWFGGAGMNPQQLFADARRDAEQALALAPDLPASHLALGYNDYWGHGDYTGALKAFAEALKIRPNDADTLAARGFVQRRQGRFDASITSLRKASTLDPRNSSLAFDLGLTYMLAGRYPDAKTALQHALALDPHNGNAKIQLSNAILLSSGNLSRALAAAAGDGPALQSWRVTLLTYRRNYPAALTLLDRVPDTPANFGPGPGGGPKALQQAVLYRLMGNATRARALYRKALPVVTAQVPQQQGINQAFAWQNLAMAELGLGRTPRGLRAVAKAQAITERSKDFAYTPELAEENAILYAEARRPDLAVPLLAKALAMPGIGLSYSPLMLWVDPAWDPIRDDAGFQALLKKYAKYKPAVIPSPATPASG